MSTYSDAYRKIFSSEDKSDIMWGLGFMQEEMKRDQYNRDEYLNNISMAYYRLGMSNELRRLYDENKSDGIRELVIMLENVEEYNGDRLNNIFRLTSLGVLIGGGFVVSKRFLNI